MEKQNGANFPILSIVIPCKNDRLLFESVGSIKSTDVEIIIVFNGTDEKFVREVQKYFDSDKRVRIIILENPNLAWALETGTRVAKSDWILFNDSDCIFGNGSVEAFIKSAKSHDLSSCVLKGDVIFAKSDSIIGNIIADSRTHHTAEVLTAYKPPLLVSKKILPRIGGYFFDSRLIWREDSDLDNRVRNAGIAIKPVEGGVIYHKCLDLKSDLRSTYRYGMGLALAQIMKIKLTEVPRSTFSTFKSKGLLPALYMSIRNRIYQIGIFSMYLKIWLGRYKIANRL